MKNEFVIARRNLVAYKKIFIRLLVAFVALLFLITLITSFTLSLNEKHRKIINENVSTNYAFSQTKLDASKISQCFQTFEVSRFGLVDYVNSAYDVKFSFIGFSSVMMRYGNVDRIPDEYIADFDIYSIENEFFTDNDYFEAGDSAQFMLGRYPQNANEVVLSYDYINSCGLDTDILGKTISLSCKLKYWVWNENRSFDENDEADGNEPEYPLWEWDWSTDEGEAGEYKVAEFPLLDNVTVCGILLDDYAGLRGRQMWGAFSPVLLVNDDALPHLDRETWYICSFDGWATKETTDYLKELDVNYVGRSFLDEINVTVNLQTVVRQLVLYFCSALIFGVVFTSFLLIEKLCSAQKKNSGILFVSGITAKRLFCIWLIQIAVVAAVSFVLASSFAIGAVYGIKAILSRTFWVVFPITVATIFETLAVGFGSILLLTLSALIYFLLRYKRVKTRELLDS